MCQIRNAVLADVDQLVEMGRAMQAEGPGFQKLTYAPEKVRAFITALAQNEKSLVLVAEDQGKIVGVFMGHNAPQWWSHDTITMDFALYVYPDYRGGTTAMRLLRKYKDWGAAQGAKIIGLGMSSGVTTEKTITLFERLGFKLSSYGFEV